MKKLLSILIATFLIAAILSGNPPTDRKEDPFANSYYKLFFYSKELPSTQRALVDSFIKIDQVTTLRTAYYLKMTRSYRK